MSMTISTVFPQAEWLPAKEVLMHTPGEEIFFGGIHCAAGLFERYFDIDDASQEHRHYMDILSGHGIRVHTVEGILNEVDIESLRSLAGTVLAYDNTGNPGADLAESESYRQDTLSKLSRADLIRCILFRPNVRLFHTSDNTGFDAEYVLRPLANLYFTRDQSITTPCGHVICNMNSPQRKGETAVIELCYSYLGRTPVLHIEGEGRLEGGDYYPAGNVSFIGCGMRTNWEGIRQMMDADVLGHDTVVVVKDHKFWQMQMHLDTYFNIIDSDLCTLAGSRLYARPGDPEFTTCDVWKRSPGMKEYSLEEKDIPFPECLRRMGMEIIGIDIQDEMHYANNYLTVSPREIVAVAGQSEDFKRRLVSAGVKVENVLLENLIRGYGAAHCMTQVLSRL